MNVLRPGHAIVVVLAVLSWAVPACRSRTPATVIARVGDAELTLEDARSHIDTSQSSTGPQLQRYIDHWVSTELLCQQARREGLDKSVPVSHRISEAQDQMLAEALLERHIYNDTVPLADSVLRIYFTAHAGEFVIREDMVRLNLLTVRSRERANAFAALVSKGATWSDAVAGFDKDTSSPPGILENIPGQWFSQHTLFPPELWRVASTLNVSDVSFPVRTTAGFCILQLLQKVQAGRPADFDIVRDEVRARVGIERERQRYEDLVGTLHKRYSVEIMVGYESSSDSARGMHHE